MAKNPPAFPIPNATDLDGYVYAPEAQGMTLRDYFAGQALPAVYGLLVSDYKTPAKQIAPLSAEAAYRVADALLAERERGQ